ncbi:glutathione S-transferase family protein [Haliea sp. E17]|uniref:glutathione S-transferase family protein n=1 Tax=Haliea sp. E17 TaxID=3401576 RepID=UPI003AAEF9FD
MYTLYIANKNYSSWSLRPWILLQALQIPFEEVLTPFDQGSSWESFRRFSPTGLVPCLVDGERSLWDSLGIVEYVAEDYLEVWPASRDARAWARCAVAEMHAGFGALRRICPMNCGLRVELVRVDANLRHDLARLDELWQQGLGRFGGPFLAGGAFTAVDAFFAPVVFRIQSYGLRLSAASDAYAQRMLALPGMRGWETAALQEPWREEQHELEILEYGRITRDLRLA